MVWSLAECGSFEEAARLGGEAIRIAEDATARSTGVIAREMLGKVYEIKGDFDRAIPQPRACAGRGARVGSHPADDGA